MTDSPLGSLAWVLPDPEPRPLRCATGEQRVKGKRVVLKGDDGFIYDSRAVSDVKDEHYGRPYVEVVDETEWYRALLAQRPVPPGLVQPWPAELVFVEG